jgi:hypothetical protein
VATGRSQLLQLAVWWWSKALQGECADNSIQGGFSAATRFRPYVPLRSVPLRRRCSSDVTGNDPSDTSVASNASFVVGWLRHLVSLPGGSALKAVALDNGTHLSRGEGVVLVKRQPGIIYVPTRPLALLPSEMMLWDATHRDIHPSPTTYDEAWNMTLEYASAIRAAFPELEIHGPISVSEARYERPRQLCASIAYVLFRYSGAGVPTGTARFRALHAQTAPTAKRTAAYLSFSGYCSRSRPGCMLDSPVVPSGK